MSVGPDTPLTPGEYAERGAFQSLDGGDPPAPAPATNVFSTWRDYPREAETIDAAIERGDSKKLDFGKARFDLLPGDAWARVRTCSSFDAAPGDIACSLLEWANSRVADQFDRAKSLDTLTLIGALIARLIDSTPGALHAARGVVEVLEFGAEKYEPHGWSKGIEYSRIVAAACRHLFAIEAGEFWAADSELPHTAHALCNVLFLIAFELRLPRFEQDPQACVFDDRPRPIVFDRVAGGAP